MSNFWGCKLPLYLTLMREGMACVDLPFMGCGCPAPHIGWFLTWLVFCTLSKFFYYCLSFTLNVLYLVLCRHSINSFLFATFVTLVAIPLMSSHVIFKYFKYISVMLPSIAHAEAFCQFYGLFTLLNDGSMYFVGVMVCSCLFYMARWQDPVSI